MLKRLRVLQVNNYSRIRGGADRYFQDLSKALSVSHDVLMFSTQADTSIGDLVNGDLFWSDLPRELDLSGNSITDMARYFWRADVKEKLAKCIQSFRPHVIHCHIYHGQLTPAVISVAKEFCIPVVQTVHDFKLICAVDSMLKHGSFCDDCQGKHFSKCIRSKCNRNSRLRSMLSAFECEFRRHLVSLSDIEKYIFVSNYQAELHLDVFPDIDAVVIPNFTQRPSMVESSSGEDLFYPTRLEEGKGIDRLIQVYQYAKAKGIHLPQCVIAGGGSKEVHYHTQVHELGLDRSIKFVGLLGVRELDRYYEQCLAVLNFSSLNETFGLTVIEAFSHGKPVFTSRDGALAGLLSENYLGGSIDFSQDLPCLLRDFSDYLGALTVRREKILQHYSDNFSPEVHVEKVVECYLEVI